MAAKQQPIIVVLDSDSDDAAADTVSREDGVAHIGSSSSSSLKVAPFVQKLYDMVEGKDEAKTKSLVRWSSTGTSFMVTNPRLFADHVLPIFFEHKYLHNFACQLNLYGFKRIKSGQWEFAHKYFQKGKLHLMKYIDKNKQPTSMAKMKKTPTPSRDYRRRMKASLNRDASSPVEEARSVQATTSVDDVQVHGLRHSKRSRHAPPWHGDYVIHYSEFGLPE